MLRRVVVENYIIFKGRQELDLESACGGRFHTLVGENSSGKSSFVALVKAASNFVDNDEDFEVIGNDIASAKAVCEFHFKHGQEFSQYFERSSSSLTRALVPSVPCVSGLFSWFSDDILRFPTQLTNLLRETFGSVPALVRVLSGRKSFNASGPTHCQFLYVVSEDVVLVVIRNNGELSAAFHDPLPAGVDLMDWCPDEAFLRKVKLDENLNESSMDLTEHPSSVESSSDADAMQTKHADLAQSSTLRYRDVKKLIMVNLLKNLSQERIDEAVSLFHEVMGDHGLDFQLDLDGVIPVRILDKGTHRIIQRVSEGTFSAFVVAALVVHPFARTIIFDEVARGMHPLQVRRLRTILMRESRNRSKCIITTTHSPEMVEVERINLIWRFQVLPSGYCQIRRVRSHYNVRDLHFIGGAEVREIFFARYIVWVEGESDKRFIEALLRMFDEGNQELLKALSEPGAATTGGTDGEHSPSYGADLSVAVENLLQDPAYKRKYYAKEVLSTIQEAVRSCIVLSISGKKNVYKATAICNDLGIPHAVVCDLDVIIPNSKENSVQSQFNNCSGLWTSATIANAKAKLLDEEQCPASKCVQDSSPELIPKLRACRTVGEVMKFYDETQRIFTWRVDGGEIEDAIRLTKSQFGKKLWPDLSFGDIKDLVVCLLQPRKLRERNPKDKDASKQPNPELLRCIFFLIHFLRDSLKPN